MSSVEKKVRKAIITDAGFASRYLPITKTVPKAMLPMGNRPVMQIVIEECAEAGIEEIIIVATPEGKPIYEDYFNNSVNRIRKQLASQGKEDRYASVQDVLDFPKIIVITQDPSLPYGNGSPIASAKAFVEGEDAFLALYSDDVVFGNPGSAKTLVDTYNKYSDASAIIMVEELTRDEISKYAAVSLKDGEYKEDQENILTDIVEKPNAEEAPTTLASYGRYLLTPDIFTYLNAGNAGKDGELWTADAIGRLNKDGGKKVLVAKNSTKWMTTGDPENYFKAHLKYVLEYESFGPKVKEWLQELQPKG
ncbi:MAG: NTP transferase domain-containing protein [Candidatus Pacebacteria bacterium]|jgi:UTP--glucose-1-phosphate uridylyltransferase|nr:NTP transferase domain-containing protein [Candidatus Paceibacterota bacterium]MBT4652785.1 NTP transferase domain-containing protein [Candidatus Paceibacterota bacterium]MBT6755942.1 NTP transferase domain-containing protein [Candidatus Paceibacterota bacterium]MBT6921155.1 NTP transferase domain-containing protein [Candidatus Paceibacterota bacterium]